jgi:hypothetical protein
MLSPVKAIFSASAALRHPSSSVAQGVDGAANVITAAIRTITGNQSSAVCSSSTIRGPEPGSDRSDQG